MGEQSVEPRNAAGQEARTVRSKCETAFARGGQKFGRAGRIQHPASNAPILFPASLRVLRPLERLLTHLPLGGQYCVVASR